MNRDYDDFLPTLSTKSPDEIIRARCLKRISLKERY